MWAVLRKDLCSEFRTRASIATVLLFALVTLIFVAFSTKLEGLGLTQDLVPDYREVLRRDPDASLIATLKGTGVPRATLLSVLLWIILFFSAMAGLPRIFVKEEEMRTVAAMRLYCRPTAVYAGKLMFNVLLQLGVTAVVLPLFVVFYAPQVAHWGLLLAILAAGAVAVAGCATILGAMVARAGGRAYLMMPLAFPLLLPVLVFAINGTAAAIHGKGGNHLLVQVSYLIAMVTVSLMLFDKVWSDA